MLLQQHLTPCEVSVFGVFLVRMRENVDQKNSEYGYFLRSVRLSIIESSLSVIS